jgi:hypothetical protein
VTVVSAGLTPGPIALNNNMLTALGKIVVNTWAIAQNTATANNGRVLYPNGSASPISWVAGALAEGGYIRGPGTGTSDTAGLYLLSNGEGVLTAATTAWLGGEKAIDMLNRRALPMLPVPAAFSANDNGSAAELRALRDEVKALQRILREVGRGIMRTEGRVGAAIIEGVGQLNRTAQDTEKRLRRAPVRSAAAA